uniref:Uncharacterized protein n=1 Tax=Anguilla anguilla TaxID=7936 RepID=A0A0E9W1Q7_ANGAN
MWLFGTALHFHMKRFTYPEIPEATDMTCFRFTKNYCEQTAN